MRPMQIAIVLAGIVA